MFQLLALFSRTVPEHRHLRSWTNAWVVNSSPTPKTLRVRGAADLLE